MMTEKQEIEQLSFEEALEELERIVDELESGEIDLEEMLDRFERAMQLREYCARLLTEAETKVEQLVNERGETEPFSTGDNDADKA